MITPDEALSRIDYACHKARRHCNRPASDADARTIAEAVVQQMRLIQRELKEYEQNNVTSESAQG